MKLEMMMSRMVRKKGSFKCMHPCRRRWDVIEDIYDTMGARTALLNKSLNELSSARVVPYLNDMLHVVGPLS